MTVSLFKFKPFSDKQIKPLIPKEVLNDFIQLAHGSIKKSRYKDAWEMCMGLFIAHLTTLYMQTIPKAVENPAEAGTVKGLVTSKSVDGVSVSRDYSQSLGDLNGWGSWKTTAYGVQLITMAKLYGMGGMYVP